MVRQSEQIWMILSVLLATSTWTGALPVTTSEPESAILLTTEVVTVTTSSTIVPLPQENANFSSVSTLPPSETTIFLERDLYTTTEYTLGGDNILIDPTISAKSPLSSEVPQVIRFEQLTRDDSTHFVNVSSHLTNRDESETVGEEVQTTTTSWSSSPLAEMGTLSQDTGTSLYMNVREPTLTIEAEVLPNVPVTHVTVAHASSSVPVESLKSISSSKEYTEGILTNVPTSTPPEEYSTTEEISTSSVPSEKTPYLTTVDSEDLQPTKEVHEQYAEEVAKHTQESSKTFESLTNVTTDFAKSTEEVAKSTKEFALSKPTKEAEKQTEEDASPKPSEETTKRTEEAGLQNLTIQETERLGEVPPVTEEVAQTTEEVKNLTAGAATLLEEFEKQTGEERNTTAEVIGDVAPSSGNKSTMAEIFISSGYTPSKTNVSSSVDNPRGSRHFTEASEPQVANGTESQPEITRKSVLSGLETNTSVTQSPVTTPNSEQPEPLTSIPFQNNPAAGDVNSTETSPISQLTSDTIPTEVNFLNATSLNATEEPITILSQLYSNTSQPITPRDVSVSIGGHAKNVSEPSVTNVVEAKNTPAPSETRQGFPTKPDKEFTPLVTRPATDPPSNPKSSEVVIPQSTSEDSETSLFVDTIRVSSPASVSLESSVSTMEKATGGTNVTVACSPKPAVSVFQGDLRYIIVLGLTGCSVAATLLLVTLVLIRLRENKQRDLSPSLQICGCLGRTQRAEITPRRAEVSEVKLRPGCNLATDADCRSGEGEDVPLALSARTVKVSAPLAPVSMAVKPNGAPPLPPKPGDSPV